MLEFTGERLEKLNEMYDYFEERMMFAHQPVVRNIFITVMGGYVEHVMHVTMSALQIKQLWEKNGATINFTDEELVFVPYTMTWVKLETWLRITTHQMTQIGIERIKD